MDDLEIVYLLRGRINKLEYKLKCLTCQNIQNNSETNRQTIARINKTEARIIKLKGIHSYKIYQVYSGLSIRPKSTPIITEMKMKINEINIGDTITTLKMTPIWFKLDDKKFALKNIIYPTDETIIIALEKFVQQYGGELSFTNENISFLNCIEHTVSGVINLSCVHLLAGNLIPTAKFSINININYDRDLTRSITTMKDFILNFNKEISYLLHCKNDFIRIFSIEKINHKHGMIKINFGITTPDKNKTESLAQHFQTLACRSDFRNEKILRFIELDDYQYELIPMLSYLQLNSNDFDINHNYDYSSINQSDKEQCGNYPYYLPNGWFRHALNLFNKYLDDNIWFGHENIDGEWPIAYHGTCLQGMKKINREDHLKNFDNEDVIEKIDTTTAGSELYVTTHCNGGADVYTTPFIISNGDQNETFRFVFQCRVRPNSFTIDNDIVEIGETWKIIDPQAIRPYGLLLKNETTLS